MCPRRTLPLLAILFVATASCGGDSEPAAEVVAPVPVRPLVETVTLQRTAFEERITLTGVTDPVRTAVLTAEVPGRIVALDIEEGQRVQEGDRVLRIDTSATASQRAQLETQAASVERDLDRARRLLGEGIGTQAQVDALETQRAIIADQIDALDVSLSQARTRAPISGVVTARNAEVGEFANPGTPLARIVDISTIIVKVGLPERDISFVSEGMEIPVTVVATGQELTGTLTRIGVEAHPASRTFPIEVSLDNSSGALRAGMRAIVDIPKRAYRDAVVIPRDSVLQGIEGTEVLIVVGEAVEKRDVTLGAGRGNFVVVESGLDGTESLVVRGHRLLVPGESVRTVDTGQCCSEQLVRVLGTQAAAPENVPQGG